MNLAEARGALANRGFDYLSGGSMDLMLNRARNDFEDHWPWPWLQATATGPAPLVLTDLKYVLLVKDAASNELQGIDIRQLGQDATDLAATGTSRWWYLVETPTDTVTMNVWPVSDTALTVAYIRQSPELSADIDTPLIPRRYHAVWIDWAVIQAYKDSDNFAAASALQGDVNARMAQIVERYETRNRQNAQAFSIRAWSEDD